jgi:steroid delta-isomerase-like uncharacterized protein
MNRASSERLIRRYYEAFNAGDMPAFLALLTDDVVHDVSQGDRQVGREAFARFMDHMNHCYRERIEDLVVMATDDGARAAAEFTVLGEYLRGDADLPPARGQRYLLRVGAFFEVREERVARVTNHYNLQDWLRQVR